MTTIGIPARSSDDWDVPVQQVADHLAALKAKAAAADQERQARRQAERERLMAKLAAYQPVPADDALRVEQEHWRDPLDHVLEHLPEQHPELIPSSDWQPGGTA